MKNELFVCFITFFYFINLGAQSRGAQTRYTIFNFGINLPVKSEAFITFCEIL